ncbi:MAG: NUDIX hydrolase [Patescibacteria group bacterium]
MNRFVPVVVAVIQNDHHEYLLTQRYSPQWPEVHLKWQLAGGKVEFGETTEQTVIRECQEEISQDIKIILPCPSVRTHIWHHTAGVPEHTLLIGYLCQLVKNNKEIKLNQETHSYKWFTFDEIKDLDRLPYSLEMIEELQTLQNSIT